MYKNKSSCISFNESQSDRERQRERRCDKVWNVEIWMWSETTLYVCMYVCVCVCHTTVSSGDFSSSVTTSVAS